LAVERDINLDTKWPILTSDFKSAASPLNPLPTCTAEIVVEKENKFDKNHVLNRLYDQDNFLPNNLQDDLPFSSLPSDSSPTDTFKSFPSNDSYLSSSQNNIAELPLDSVAVSKGDSQMSSFNSLGMSPQGAKIDNRALEMNCLENNR